MLIVSDGRCLRCRVSFLWKGYHLEHKLGSMRFAVAVGCLLVLAHVLVVVVALGLATFFNMPVRRVAG